VIEKYNPDEKIKKVAIEAKLIIVNTLNPVILLNAAKINRYGIYLIDEASETSIGSFGDIKWYDNSFKAAVCSQKSYPPYPYKFGYANEVTQKTTSRQKIRHKYLFSAHFFVKYASIDFNVSMFTPMLFVS
jgi:hypothetical protein